MSKKNNTVYFGITEEVAGSYALGKIYNAKAELIGRYKDGVIYSGAEGDNIAGKYKDGVINSAAQGNPIAGRYKNGIINLGVKGDRIGATYFSEQNDHGGAAGVFVLVIVADDKKKKNDEMVNLWSSAIN